MNRRTLAFGIIILSLILIGLIVYFLFFYNFERDVDILRGGNNQEEQGTGALSGTEQKKPVVKQIVIKKDNDAEMASKEELDRFNLVKIAGSFAERFGSYSNQSNFENITDLEIFMSDRMKKWAKGFVKEQREKIKYADIYQGVITKTISTEVKNFDETNGAVMINVQKTESTGNKRNSSVYYEDILITFVKEGGTWKVDSAIWQK